jgi:hypothetical protein
VTIEHGEMPGGKPQIQTLKAKAATNKLIFGSVSVNTYSDKRVFACGKASVFN